MLKENIAYTDYNGLERKEDFYFNLTKAELLKMEMGTTGGLAEKIKKIVEAQDYPAIYNIFEDLVLTAYGIKSDDGKRFIKSKEISEAFSQTEAFSELIMKLATDADYATKFVKGIIPEINN